MDIIDEFLTTQNKEKYLNQCSYWFDKLMDIPELGFKEYKTSKLIENWLKGNFGNIDIQTEIAQTGIKATLNINDNGPHICIICELDSIICMDHPKANGEGAVHACGHNFQMATIMNAFSLLNENNIISNLTGKISFIAVPSEEYVDFEYRETLCKEGKIKFYSGKQEFIRLGIFDDIDIAIMLHAMPDSPRGTFYTRGTSLGFRAKTIEFKGKAAHGSTPHLGKNALSAATIALQCINSNRELFRDEDHIRIHPIITQGGTLVNVVPDKVVIETFVRGSSLEAINFASDVVDRSVKGAAIAMGVEYTINDLPGYLPLIQDNELSEVYENSVKSLPWIETVIENADLPGSTDMGDLSHILPSIHPSVGGFNGSLHSKEFMCTDNAVVTLDNAVIIAKTVYSLLVNNGEKADEVISSFKGKLKKEEYLDHLFRGVK